MNAGQALRAIVARINGVFDDPDLSSVGPLLPDAQADILRIAESVIVAEQDGPNDDAFREAASNQADDDLSFDEGAAVSESEDGAWVQAWVWVSNSAAGVS